MTTTTTTPLLGDRVTFPGGLRGTIARIENGHPTIWTEDHRLVYRPLGCGHGLAYAGDALEDRAAAYCRARLECRTQQQIFAGRSRPERGPNDPAGNWGDFERGQPAPALDFWAAVLRLEMTAIWEAAAAERQAAAAETGRRA